jgi:hypothetical protein
MLTTMCNVVSGDRDEGVGEGNFHSEHPVFFLMSGNRNEHLRQEIIMKKWCEMSVSPRNILNTSLSCLYIRFTSWLLL